MDCTFCLDCVKACPHENVGIVAVTPGAELWSDSFRSGIGRWSKRRDLAALVAILAFGAFANAAMMTGPVMDWRDRITDALGFTSSLPATTALCLVAFVMLPFLAVSGAAASSSWLSEPSTVPRKGRSTVAEVARLPFGVATNTRSLVTSAAGGMHLPNWSEIAARYCVALVPLGFGMWLAHYCFHFFTSYATIVPTTQRFAADLGSSSLGEPQWSCACCLPTADWLLRLEIVFLDLGLLMSLYAGQRIARSQTPRWPQALAAFTPWGLLMVILFVAGIWILFQPMQMRGTM